jgi:hypothetical protein
LPTTPVCENFAWCIQGFWQSVDLPTPSSFWVRYKPESYVMAFETLFLVE